MESKDPIDSETPCLLDVVQKTLNEQEWSFEVKDFPGEEESRKIVQAGCSGQNGSYRLTVDVNASNHCIVIYVTSQIKVPQDKRHLVAEYLTRANYGMVLGNFEMDFRDGEVRYKGSINVDGGFLAPRMFSRLLGCATVSMDRYFAQMMAIIYGGKSPVDALAEVEGGKQSQEPASSSQ